MMEPTPYPTSGRYLALGDSYTVGEGVPAPGTWPYQLAAAMRAQGIGLEDPQDLIDDLDSALRSVGL